MKRAFTLVELIVVITIIGTIALIATSSIPDISLLRTDMAARKMQSDIRYAQSLAVNSQRRTGVLFSTVLNRYAVYIENTYGAGDWTAVIEPLRRENFLVQLNSGDFIGVGIFFVYFNQANRALLFDKWGNPYSYVIGAGTTTPLNNPAGIVIRGTGGSKFIFVERGTGRVGIQ